VIRRLFDLPGAADTSRTTPLDELPELLRVEEAATYSGSPEV
jgi:hypothetical protein